MKTFYFSKLILLAICFFVCVDFAYTQENSFIREATALNFQPGKEVLLIMKNNPRYSKMSATAKVERTVREGTKIQLKIRNLPAVLDLGGLYTTYVLWTIGVDGTTRSIGVVVSSRKGTSSPTVSTSTPLLSFALLVTAEPHALVNRPSPKIMLENSLPSGTGQNLTGSLSVRYSVNNSDYFNNEKYVGVDEKAMRKLPLAFLGAERAVQMASFAGAETDAVEKFNEASRKLEELRIANSKKVKNTQIEQMAAQVISLAAQAERTAEETRRLRKENRIESQKAAVLQETKTDLAIYKNKSEELDNRLEREESRRASAERERNEAVRNYDELEKETIRLRNDLASTKEKLATIETEKNLLTQRLELLSDFPLYRQFFMGFGKVNEEKGILTVTLPANIWKENESELNPNIITKLEPFFDKISSKKGFQILILVTVSGVDEEENLILLAEERAAVIASYLKENGVESERIKITATANVTPKSGKARYATETKISLGLFENKPRN